MGRSSIIAGVAVVGIAFHLALRIRPGAIPLAPEVPLYVVLFGGGVPLVVSLALKLVRGSSGRICSPEFRSSPRCCFGEYLAGALVVLMLSGGEALEAFALGRASSVLQALARRMPLVAHRRTNRQVAEVPLDDGPRSATS